jgi:hypothetical protein
LGAYYLETEYDCLKFADAWVNGYARLTLSQGGVNPLYISEECKFFEKYATGAGWNEGSIGFPGPVPMGVSTIHLSIPRNVIIEAGRPLLATVEVEFVAGTFGSGEVLLDFNSADHLKINFAGLIMTVESVGW